MWLREVLVGYIEMFCLEDFVFGMFFFLGLVKSFVSIYLIFFNIKCFIWKIEKYVEYYRIIL